MVSATATEFRVAKKRVPRTPQAAADEADTERIEFQAPKGFTAEIDEVATSLGMTRSAFIRNTLILRIREEKKA